MKKAMAVFAVLFIFSGTKVLAGDWLVSPFNKNWAAKIDKVESEYGDISWQAFFSHQRGGSKTIIELTKTLSYDNDGCTEEYCLIQSVAKIQWVAGGKFLMLITSADEEEEIQQAPPKVINGLKDGFDVGDHLLIFDPSDYSLYWLSSPRAMGRYERNGVCDIVVKGNVINYNACSRGASHEGKDPRTLALKKEVLEKKGGHDPDFLPGLLAESFRQELVKADLIGVDAFLKPLVPTKEWKALRGFIVKNRQRILDGNKQFLGNGKAGIIFRWSDDPHDPYFGYSGAIAFEGKNVKKARVSIVGPVMAD